MAATPDMPPCRIALILIDGKTPPAWRQIWKK
jgi:hypothetical protein